MKILFLIITSVFLFSFGLGAVAQETELLDSGITLSDPGMTPDSPFYFFERIAEEIGTFFTFGDLNKANRYADLVSERIAEAKAMADKEKSEAVQNALDRYEKQLNQFSSLVEKAKKSGEKIEKVTEKLAEATTKHLSAFDEMLEKVPEEGKAGILKAKQISIEGYKDALKSLSEENIEKAAKIDLKTAEDRLNQAKVKLEEGKTEAVEDAVNEFKELRQFGEEISKTAQGLGKDVTNVEQLVGKATSTHLKILTEVYENAQEQTKPVIEEAMKVSVKGHEKAVEILKETGKDLDEIPEKIQMLERIPSEVKEKIEREVREEIEKEKVEIKKIENLDTQTPGP